MKPPLYKPDKQEAEFDLYYKQYEDWCWEVNQCQAEEPSEVMLAFIRSKIGRPGDRNKPQRKPIDAFFLEDNKKINYGAFEGFCIENKFKPIPSESTFRRACKEKFGF